MDKGEGEASKSHQNVGTGTADDADAGNASADVLAKRTVLGASWTVSARLGGRLIDFVTLIILARALGPEDFGLTALAMSLTVIVDTVFEVPLIQALTRLSVLHRSHLHTAFTVGIIRGILLALFVLAAAWPFSIIYNDHRLMPLIAVLAIAPIARGLYSPATVHYIRKLDFRPIFIAELTGRVIGATAAIAIAYNGGGYWAIAASSVVSASAQAIITYILAPYWPRFTLKNFADFSTFLGWFSTSQIFSALSWQFDRALLGYWVPKSDLGQFTMASDVSVLPTQSLIGPAMQPVMAAFSRINDDRERLQRAFLKASCMTMMVAMPAAMGMNVTADLIVSTMLGPKWTEAAFLLQWFAIAILLSAYYQCVYSLALALNRARIIFNVTCIELVARLIFVPLGLYFFSIIGAVGARGATAIIVFSASIYYVKMLIGLGTMAQLVNLWKPAAASLIMAFVVDFARYELPALGVYPVFGLAVCILLGAAVYGMALYAFGIRLSTYLDLSRFRRSAAVT